MADTKIQWTDKVWNPVTGCAKVSQGCKNCYAETIAKRFWGERKFTDVQCHEERLTQPLHWKKPAKIFVNSMSDLFHESVSFDFVQQVFEIMLQCPQHIFQILTKRADRMNWFVRPRIPLLKNLWLGVSVENQQTAKERIPLLLQTPAAVRFLSVEPMLGAIDLNYEWGAYQDGNNSPIRKLWLHGIDWVICGGESGPNARPMHPDWVRSLRDQCKAANVPFFFKQWGEWIHEDLLEPKIFLELFNKKTSKKYKQLTIPNGYSFDNYVWYGKKKAGRLLDGVEHNEFPKEVKNEN